MHKRMTIIAANESNHSSTESEILSEGLKHAQGHALLKYTAAEKQGWHYSWKLWLRYPSHSPNVLHTTAVLVLFH